MVDPNQKDNSNNMSDDEKEISIPKDDKSDSLNQNVPDEVVDLATDIILSIENESNITFVRTDIINSRFDEDAGSVYDVMYYAKTFNNINIPIMSMQVRLLIDKHTYQLNDICIINPQIDPFNVEKTQPSSEYYDIYYNYLWPAFMGLDFDSLFEHRPYKLMDKSDDFEHSEDKFYTEYVVDFKAIYGFNE